MAHRVSNRLVVRHVRLLPLLTPADDDEKRIVDRDAEPDERDEKLDDHRDVGDARDWPDQQEGGRDRDECHQQRHDRHEGAEDEDQDEERAQRCQQSSDQNAGAAALVFAAGGAQRVEPRHLDRGSADGDAGQRSLGLSCLGLPLVDSTLGRDVDEREGGAAVVRHECPVTG